MEIETSRHLFQPTMYRGLDGTWDSDLGTVLDRMSGDVEWDWSAILSILSFGFVCGDRTLVRGITRRPWLSSVDRTGQIDLEAIPPHNTYHCSADVAAAELKVRLREEARAVCADRSDVYVLLSGGLDSRIVAAIVAELVREGEIKSPATGVSWGIAESRDCEYGRTIAEMLGMPWRHVPLGSEHIVANLHHAATRLGALLAPHHLHRMDWLRDHVPENAVILSGSYGDSVGRAEFSGSHVLAIEYLKPTNANGLLQPGVLQAAAAELHEDLRELHLRAPDAPKYVHCEHERQGHYMRNMLAHAMTLMNNRGRVYQMFTDPRVYEFMWSLHPAMRVDDIYACLLERLDPRLARLPWARNNKALRGRTIGARRDLCHNYHDYSRWIKGPVFEEVARYVDPDWFAAAGPFDGLAVRALHNNVRQAHVNPGAWLWLATFRRYADWLGEHGKRIITDAPDPSSSATAVDVCWVKPPGPFRRVLRRATTLRSRVERVRLARRRRGCLRRAWRDIPAKPFPREMLTDGRTPQMDD